MEIPFPVPDRCASVFGWRNTPRAENGNLAASAEVVPQIFARVFRHWRHR